MLKQLSISNYALIDQVEVSFDRGLTIITGETGAGKSILLGALGLILGERADNSALRDLERKCVVEGVFNVEGYQLESFFEQNELDFSADTVIRREVVAGGKSRAFINDTPVGLNVLKDLGEFLIDIHAQHQTRLLNSTGFQLNLVDVYAQHKELLFTYRSEYNNFIKLNNKQQQLQEELEKAMQNQSFFQFQFNELDEAKLDDAEELIQIEAELNVLTHAEVIKQALQQTSLLIKEGEVNATDLLANAKNGLIKVASYDSRLAELSTRLESLYQELKDLDGDLQRLDNSTFLDEERLQKLSERNDQLNRLIAKHRLSDLAELIALKDSLLSQLNVISFGHEELEKTAKEIEALQTRLEGLCAELSKGRAEAAPKVMKVVNDTLAYLGMNHAELRVALEYNKQQFKATGKDEIRFLLKSNLGGEFQPIEKTASGGELSRIMLCLKAASASKTIMPTIIFDEIDTGVSGEVASKMGAVLRRLGQSMQVISISHLPQIAGKGNAHYKVSKYIDGGTTHSKISRLNQEERVLEIAGMISGTEISEAAIANARALLQE